MDKNWLALLIFCFAIFFIGMVAAVIEITVRPAPQECTCTQQSR